MSEQHQFILEHLNDPTTGKQGLSQFEAMGLYRIMRLASRIHELKVMGHKIKTTMKRDRTGKSYARYYLKK